MGELDIKFEWLPRDYGDAVERATLADLSITIDGNVATKIEDGIAKTVRYSARLSAYHLAVWFAANWWRLRWEPEPKSKSTVWAMGHAIGAAGGGYVWPNLAFSSDGGTILAVARPTAVRETEAIRYLSDFSVSIDARTFERGVDHFVDAVLRRLEATRINETDLRDLWSEVLAERQDIELSRVRRVEALLGFDPGEAPDDLLTRLNESAERFGQSATEEVAAVEKAESEMTLSRLADLQKDVGDAGAPIRIPELAALRKAVDGGNAALLPWERATQMSKIARSVWSLGKGPVSTVALAGILDIRPDTIGDAPSSHLTINVGFRDRECQERLSVVFRKKHPTSRRFALARIVADHVAADRVDTLLPATDAKTQRQKFQRAFAQEFLCPYDELLEFLDGKQPSDELIEEAAEHFVVSPLLVKTVLVNKGALERESLVG